MKTCATDLQAAAGPDGDGRAPAGPMASGMDALKRRVSLPSSAVRPVRGKMVNGSASLWGHVAATPRRMVGAVLLGAVEAAVNCLTVQPFPDVASALGAVLVFYAALALGPVLALVTAFLAYLPTLYLWEQPFTLCFGVVEAVVFGYLYVRFRGSALRSFLLFWSLVGMPVLAWTVFVAVAVPAPVCWVLLFKYPFNSGLALLMALVLLRSRALADLTGSVIPEASLPLGRILFTRYTPVVVVPILVVALSLGTLATQRYVAQQQAQLRRAAEEIAFDLTELLGFLQRAVAEAAAEVAGAAPDQLPGMLERVHRAYPQFAAMLVTDAQGMVISSTQSAAQPKRSPMMARSVADRDYYRVPMATGQVFTSDGFKGRFHGSDLIFGLSAPVLDAAGRRQGVVEASVLLQDMLSGHQPLLRKWNNRNFAVLDRKGRVILWSEQSGYRPLENLRLRFGLVPHGPGSGVPDYFAEVRRPGARAETVLRTLALMRNPEWLVAVGLPMQEVIRDASNAALLVLLWLIVGWLIAVWITRVVSERITAPFAYLRSLLQVNDPAGLVAGWRSRPRGMPVELEELGCVLMDSHTRIGRANEDLRVALAERDEANRSLQALSSDLERQVGVRTKELEKARETAERASRSKSEFVAHLSHELRTPLNAILGAVQLLRREQGGRLPVEATARLEQIASGGALLRNLIEEVLDLAKIESGTVELQPVRLDAAALVRECAALFEANAARRGIRLRLETEVADGWLVADRRRLLQVFMNLLGNALKFTPSGGEVVLSMAAAPGTGDGLVFRVRDSGRGISAEEQRTLFDPYMQGAAARATDEPGTGLGLPLVKRLVELHHGTIEVESTVGRGSCFTVTLARRAFVPGTEPAPDNAPSVPVAAPKEGRRSGRVLIAEDHAPNAEILADFCQLEGLEAHIAANGVEAVEQARALLPDLILMDWRMPLLEGPEAIQQLKSDPRTASIPVVALTAFAQPQDAARMAEVGAAGFLTKPVDFSRLLTLFSQLNLLPAVTPANG